MAKTQYTKWVSSKYKKKTYYIRGWIEYTLAETGNTKSITYKAGFEIKNRKYNGSDSMTVTVSDTLGTKKKGKKKFEGGNSKTAKITFIGSTTWKWDKKTTAQNIKVKFTADFGKTLFSGKKATAEIPINIGAKSKPSVTFTAVRDGETSTINLSLTVKPDRQLMVYVPNISRDGDLISPSWGVTFPQTISTETTYTATDTLDIMHGAVYDYVGLAGGYEHTGSSEVNYVHQPEWRISEDDPNYVETSEHEPAILVSDEALPDINYLNNAVISVYAYDYSTNQYTLMPNDNGWQIEAIDSTHWKIPISFTDPYVSNSASQTGKAKFYIKYTTYATSDVKDNVAIFDTHRNANFSTGLANNVFLGGCGQPDYSSRVWYSAVNNPLYMPDTNFIEVGSNDTRVMGLVKVGDYLGVIKQSKSIDSSVFLVYPTSFDDETTFATKACVSGVGALGQFCFNVLGDETLFLSPDGIMAIEPYEDEASRVKDRSFFINGRLLGEPFLDEKSYSFVWKGYYLLAINNHVYVLDGNQRNSWGNQKTNLVYECYFLDNVPAKTLFSYDGQLWFSDDKGNLCRFKTEADDDPYSDNGEPVVARWSTIADDDGSLHYLKNLAKKGTVVSLLPEKGTTARVYINKDDAIGKDNGIQPVVEGEPIPEGTILPPSVYPKKKVKKYKRLQFIVEDVTASPFGINEIIKSYTVGNYAKK